MSSWRHYPVQPPSKSLDRPFSVPTLSSPSPVSLPCKMSYSVQMNTLEWSQWKSLSKGRSVFSKERKKLKQRTWIFPLDAIDRLVVAWPWTGWVSFWNLIFHSLCSLRRWRNLASVYVSWLSYFHLPLPCPNPPNPHPFVTSTRHGRENEAISTTGFLSSGYLFKLMAACIIIFPCGRS